MENKKTDVLIIGSGTAGLNAMGRVKRAGKSFLLVNGGEAGTTCARVGCMPSKALIQVGEDFHRKSVYPRMGIENFESTSINHVDAMEYVRDLRDNFVDRVLSNSTDHLGEQFIEQYATFISPDTVKLDDGSTITADSFVLATGSTPVIPDAWKQFGDRVFSTDEFFELEELPNSVAVIGLGVIGLEIGQALSRMGVEVTGFDLAEQIGGITDPEVNKSAVDILSKQFPLHLGAAVEISEEDNGQLRVSAGDNSVVVDKVFASLGRRPNLDRLGLENTGIELNDRGLPDYNPNTMQIGDSRFFIAGDLNGERPILHEAGDEGKIAGFNAAHDSPRAFKRKVPLAITFSDPNIVSVGQRFSELDAETTVTGSMMIAPVGRALIMANNKGIIKVYADKASGRLLGAEMISPKGENLGHLLAWALEQEMTVGQMIQMPFYHPVLEEALQAALNSVYHKVDAKNESPITELETLD
ncbi:MAG: dihydrolipoyl dehydrogenase [bacterium]